MSDASIKTPMTAVNRRKPTNSMPLCPRSAGIVEARMSYLIYDRLYRHPTIGLSPGQELSHRWARGR